MNPLFAPENTVPTNNLTEQQLKELVTVESSDTDITIRVCNREVYKGLNPYISTTETLATVIRKTVAACWETVAQTAGEAAVDAMAKAIGEKVANGGQASRLHFPV